MKDFYGNDATRLKDKKLFLFDMDGTIYLGENLFEGVPELLQKIENGGGRYVFITNNASKSVLDYVKKLHRLGFRKTEYLTKRAPPCVLFLFEMGIFLRITARRLKKQMGGKCQKGKLLWKKMGCKIFFGVIK